MCAIGVLHPNLKYIFKKLYFYFEKGSHVSEASFKLVVQPRILMNLLVFLLPPL